MQMNVITPFSRFENKNFYLENFVDKNVVWHPLLTPDDAKKFITDDLPSWVKPYVIPRVPTDRNIVKYKLNMYLIDGDVQDNERYMVLCDDDWVEADFFKKLEEIQDDIILVSMKRGHHYLGGHPIETLIADPNFSHVGTIGFEQMIIKGKILQQIRFRSDHDLSSGYPSHRQGDSDGHAYEMLAKLFPIKYCPEIFVLFNLLEPGRWDR